MYNYDAPKKPDRLFWIFAAGAVTVSALLIYSAIQFVMYLINESDTIVALSKIAIGLTIISSLLGIILVLNRRSKRRCEWTPKTDYLLTN